MRYVLEGVFVFALLGLVSAAFSSRAADQPAKPKIRAVTAFIRLDRAHPSPPASSPPPAASPAN